MKLTLRDLFGLMLVAGLAISWGLLRRSRYTQLENAVELIRLADDDARLWQFRADSLAQRARQSGWKVDWSGTLNDHTIDIQSPDEIKQSTAEE